LNKKITWRERSIGRTAAHKFPGVSGRHHCYQLFPVCLVDQPAVCLLYSMAKPSALAINYLVANLITLLGVMALNYEISDRWAFAEPKEKGSRRERLAARQAKASGRPSIAKT